MNGLAPYPGKPGVAQCPDCGSPMGDRSLYLKRERCWECYSERRRLARDAKLAIRAADRQARLAARRSYTVEAGGCWRWNGYIADHGYGALTEHGKSVYAHRWMFEQKRGPIPEGMYLDHLCRNPACVNPDHLEPVTHAENLRRGIGTKLTWEDVGEIRRRRAAGDKLRELAAEFGVCGSHVSRICNGKYWTAV